ncbi:phospholipase D3 isoform X2 [Gouania willdenowi]|uniref:phospholipase D3 isoform X2 n=1 Tax=Gouania willdenowi TaxID=441366 RepID=UPI001054CB19|nr:phospholipase D3-like isoform X2 [Gouania willdenowi]
MDQDESDSEVMERHQTELEETDPTSTALKCCSIVLDRIQTEDNSQKKELGEKDDMNRKGGKPASRIPTFHKRPTNLTTEPLVTKRDAVHVSPPIEKDAGDGVEASEVKPSEETEATPIQPAACVNKLSFEVQSVMNSKEEEAAAAPSSITTAPKSWSVSESVLNPLLTASPRPALRTDPGQTTIVEDDTMTEISKSLLPQEGFITKKPWEDRLATTITGTRDTNKSAEMIHSLEVGQVEAIMDEEPPWEMETIKAAHLKISRSSSEAECDEEPEGEIVGEQDPEKMEVEEKVNPKSELLDLGEQSCDPVEAPFTAAPEKEKPVKSVKSGCSSLSICCLLPLTLLLLGGFGHVWQYGLPRSMAQLAAQLELHWLQGLVLMPEPCSTDCRVHLIESIPVGLYPESPSTGQSIANSWLRLLGQANSSVQIAAFYFTLRDSNPTSSDSQGRQVFEQLKKLGSKGVKLQITVNHPQTFTEDTAELAAAGAEVREVDLQAISKGILHTKLWVVDQKHFYVGSANMDWRSLSEVKEVGLAVEDCSCLAQDASRIFEMYWSIGGTNGSFLPLVWPARLSALSSSQNPLQLKFNGVPAQVYLSSAPPQISARGRSDDLSAILSVIKDAQKFIYISVMDYLPLSEYQKPVRFWPAIDSELRAAACTRGVHVRLMVSCWEHSNAAMFTFLQSLLVLNRTPLKCKIEVSIFTVPSNDEQKKILFARVSHAKYMVTDRVVYIGTSNWSENYFVNIAGVGLVVNQTDAELGPGQWTLQSQAKQLFLRDWSSQYSSALSVDNVDVCPRRRPPAASSLS